MKCQGDSGFAAFLFHCRNEHIRPRICKLSQIVQDRPKMPGIEGLARDGFRFDFSQSSSSDATPARTQRERTSMSPESILPGLLISNAGFSFLISGFEIVPESSGHSRNFFQT
jgi:hypothetical protein